MKLKFVIKKIRICLYYISIIVIMYGCAFGNQPVVWKTAGDLDFDKSVQVDVNATVKIPSDEIEFIKKDIEEKLSTIFTGNSKGIYKLIITITEYKEGDAGARFVMFGLGNMYLNGDVKLIDSEAQIEIRDGEFKKKYSAGGIIGAAATMRNDLTSKVGKAIAEALKK